MIDVVEMREDDILILTIPIGTMPPSRALEYVNGVKAALRSCVKSTQKVICLTVRDGDMQMSIIKQV
jgi:hypothetical protein